MTKSKNYWKNTICLVTGGAGFLGQKLTSRLRQLEANPIVIRSQDCDLRNDRRVDRTFRRYLPRNHRKQTVVFHLAATVGGIGATSQNPGKYIYDNISMGMNVIDVCRRLGVDKLIVAGSVCAYPERCPVPMIEENLWEGKPEKTNAPYGISKRAILAMLEAYYQQYGLKSSYLLMANLYGTGDDFSDETSHVIPALIKRFVDAKRNNLPQVVVWGSGRASRDMLFVDDAAEAYILAAEKISEPIPINIGTGKETTIAFIAEYIKKTVGYEGDIIYDTSKPDGQMRRGLRIDRANQLLGWTPKTDIQSGIAATVEWYMSQDG